MADATTTRPLRADAARNRRRVLDAAREAFDAHGTDVSLEDVARAAGVGVGTLYRHFPTRLDLVEAAYRDSVEQFVAQADLLLDREPAGEALDAWVMGFVDYVVRKKGMAAALRAGLGDEAGEIFATSRANLEAAAARLVAAAQADGAIRTDVEALDVLRAVSGVCLAGAGAVDRERTTRVLRIVLDGLRWSADAPS
ncbi:TetR/AcrR family transcriptional regulator [Cellulomonas sp. SLBN-39]|uniref:TetR/AcrR family transcriptional regulator n=1 Tax=Cellulomonas sp. SLBN-39 TaxID=2768446 RepID=UPI00114EFBCB|nr:TetR/AcrR family transcriptional regulator [Cellulomonas sp. SLBN-39]TQL01206.1 TetR family transcriptional regulator [Cellulomonas sp. SLBN-39]